MVYYFYVFPAFTVGENSLDAFTESLSKFTRFTSFRSLATLSYTSDLYNTSSIVSSIEFDRDADYFAIAGVTKKIKVQLKVLYLQANIHVHERVIKCKKN